MRQNRGGRIGAGGAPRIQSPKNFVVDVDESQVDTEAIHRAVREHVESARYCPSCGWHYRPEDVRWIEGTPVCRDCGYRPLKKVK